MRNCQIEKMPEQTNHRHKLELSDAERQLVTALSAGETAQLSGAPIRASILRAIAFGRGALCDLTTFGIRLQDARITGRIDLDGCSLDTPFVLTNITIEDDHSSDEQNPASPLLSLCDANLKQVRLSGLHVSGAVLADRAIVANGMLLEQCTMKGSISLAGARIGHTLSFQSSEIGDGLVALNAPELVVDGSLSLQGGRFLGSADLSRCQIGSSMNAQAAEFASGLPGSGATGPTRAALVMDSATVAGDLLLNDTRFDNSVRMENARVGGRLEAMRMNIEAPTGEINLDGIDVQKSVCLDDASIRGVLRIVGARIGKLFVANRLTLDGGETAIEADLISTGGNWEMTDGRLIGQLRCPGARIDGQMRLSDTKIFGSELALRGDGMVIRGGYFASRSLMVGLVRLPGAHIGNQFRLRKATIKVEAGAALLASGARFDRDIEIGSGFETIGAVVLDQAHIAGVCDLDASRIRSAAIARLAATQPPPVATSGRQDDDAARFDEISVSLVDAEVGRLQMPRRNEDRPRGIVNLSRAHIGALEDWSASWPPTVRQRNKSSDGRDIDHLVLDGLVYDHLVNPAGLGGDRHNREEDRAGMRRMIWLDGQQRFDVAEHFRPQPWVQLSSRLAAQGLSREAEKVTIGRRRRERLSHASTALGRFENRFLDWTALFGYSPWRTVVWSFLVVILFAGIWGWAADQCKEPGCFDQTVFVTSNRDAYAQKEFDRLYPGFNSFAYSLDQFLPIVSLGQSNNWHPNDNFRALTSVRVPNLPAFLTGATDKDRIMTRVTLTTGQLLYWLGLLQGLLGITLISLLITSLTGLLRDAR